MNPGTLDRKIEIQRKIEGAALTTAAGDPLATAAGEALVTHARSTFGEALFSWVTLYNCWARKLESKGAEREASGREIGQRPTTFRIRYRSDITLRDRILYNGQPYDITSYIEIGRRAWLDVETTLHSDAL